MGFPQGLTATLPWAKQRFGNPQVFITANRTASFDPLEAAHGRVRDPLRLSYLHRHSRAAHAAIQAGCKIQGYFVWSLLEHLD